jgi:ribosome maturation factor RimP
MFILYLCRRNKDLMLGDTRSPNFFPDNEMIRKQEIEGILKEVLGKDDFLVSVAVSHSNKITVTVDSYQGATIDKCINISRRIESKLDRDKEDFELEVTTPGLDSSFKVREQYIKHIGKEVKLYIKDNPLRGKLLQLNETSILFGYEVEEKTEGKKKKQKVLKQEEIEIENIKWIKPVIKFK